MTSTRGQKAEKLHKARPSISNYGKTVPHHARLSRTAALAVKLDRYKISTTHQKRKRFVISKKTAALVGFAISILLVTGYVSFDTWRVNRDVEKKILYVSDSAAGDGNTPQNGSQEGKDEKPVSQSALASYRVDPHQPRALYISKLNISARLLPMSINKDGSLQSPKNIYDAGWYKNSSSPGVGGAVVIDAHASGPTRQGLFAYLNTLKEGDIIQIETGDMNRYKYKVVAFETVAKNKVDMQKLMLPFGNQVQGANFITCTGKWNEKEQTYDDRVIVYTAPVI